MALERGEGGASGLRIPRVDELGESVCYANLCLQAPLTEWGHWC